MRTSLVPFFLVLAAALALGPRARALEGTPARPSPALGDPAEPAAHAEDPAATADELFERAQADDARGDYGAAARRYRAAVAKLPSFRYAAKANTRAALLEAHAEGGWGPFARLEAVRHDPNASNDPSAIDALAAAADSFPPGPTRGEARMLCAEAYVSRLHRRADGEATLRKVVDDPLVDGLVRREAGTELVTALIDDGDLATAADTARALGRLVDAKIGARVTELLRRRRAHFAAIGDLALFALLAGLAIGRTATRGRLEDVGSALKRTLPVGALFAVYSACVGGCLASSYETGNAGPFIAFAAALLPVSATAIAWGAAGSPKTGPRLARAIFSATAVVAAAFLTLEAVNGQYLESFKL